MTLQDWITETLTQLPISVLTIVGGIILLRFFHQQRMAEIKVDAERKQADANSLASVILLLNEVLRGIQEQVTINTNTGERTGNVLMELVQRVHENKSTISEHEIKAAARHDVIDTKLQSLGNEQRVALNLLDGKVNSIQRKIDDFPNLVQASTDKLFEKLKPALEIFTNSLKTMATNDELQTLTHMVTNFIEAQAQKASPIKEISDGTNSPTLTGTTPDDSSNPSPTPNHNPA